MSFENIGKRETLPEKVSKTIKESILNGELKGGDSLPTEPELEEQFGVSRAVIRDAIRMLKAQGLVEVKHGKGMYVTHSQLDAFTDALLTTLRRNKASAWDVEQFEQIFLPQVIGLAAEASTEEERGRIGERGSAYLREFRRYLERERTGGEGDPAKSEALVHQLFLDFMHSIFDASHNKMVALIGEVLLSLRKWRSITGAEDGFDPLIRTEECVIGLYIRAVETGSSKEASKMIAETLAFDEKMADIMKKTPVGTSPEIPGDLFFSSFKDLF